MSCFGLITDAWNHLDLIVRSNEEWAAWVQAIFTIVAMGFSIWQFKAAAASQRQDRRDVMVRTKIDSLSNDVKKLQPPFAVVSAAAFVMKNILRNQPCNPGINEKPQWEEHLQELETALEAAIGYPAYSLSNYRQITAFNHFLTSLKAAIKLTKVINGNIAMLSDERFIFDECSAWRSYAEYLV